MCMSVKTIEQRVIDLSKKQVLDAKLNHIAQNDNIDNCSLNMMDDSYGFKFIYALKSVVGYVVELEERLVEFKNNRCTKFATV